MFVEEEQLRLTRFESFCKKAHRILKLRCPKFLRKRLKDPIYLSGIKVTEDEVFSFTILAFLASLAIFIPISLVDFPSSIIFMIFPPFVAYNVFTYPIFYSDVIRIRAGNETVSIILYMVTYLSLNPVYEKAIQFAASRCHGPLGNDLKKVVWDVQSGKYTNIKDALAVYSRKWTLWNEEFVNCLIMLQLIEVQATESGRNEILMNVTSRIMNSTYLKMEKYAFDLKMPSMLLLLFGITLPLMGLVMFPMVSIFLTKSVNPLYIAIGYTVILPFFLWWFLYRMVSKRPATYSHSEKLEEVEPSKYIVIKKLRLRLLIIPTGILLGFLVMIPGLMYYLDLYSNYHYIFSTNPPNEAQKIWEDYCLERYEPEYIVRDTTKAMFVIWGLAIPIIFSTYFRSEKPYKLDQFIRKLEKDFIDGMFELQSALRQNVPVETAVGKVLEHYRRLRKENTPIAIFFRDLYDKMVRFGVAIKQALFGKDGLLKKLPSSMIRNIMGIVTSALYKGPLIAASVTRNVVSYLKRLSEIEHIIKKTMNEIITNLKMQGEFIGPFIAAIVASSAVIIIQLLQAVAKALKEIEEMYNFGTHIGEGMHNTLVMINLKKVMPPTIMELIAGVYLIEVVVITAVFIAGIQRGFSKVYRDHLIARLLAIAIVLFTIVFFMGVLLFQPVVKQIGV